MSGEGKGLDWVDDVEAVLAYVSTVPLRLCADNLVERPWGGRQLVAFKGLDEATHPGCYGESFEVAADPDDPEAEAHPSVVEFADGSTMPLAELLARAGTSVLGHGFFAAYGPKLPLLPKFLDVEGLLSVQAHPRGNPELYLVVDCEPGASLYLGLRETVDGSELAAELAAGLRCQRSLLELMEAPAERRLQRVLGRGLGTVGEGSDELEELAEALSPALRRYEDQPRLRELLRLLVRLYRRVLGLMHRIELRPGMVLFNADPPGPRAQATPSAQLHCLGNPEGKAALVLEIRRPGPTFRAWDHVRFPMRELAIERALSVASLSATRAEDFAIAPQALAGRPGVWRSVSCPAFVVDHLRPRSGQVVEAAAEGLPTTLHAVAGVVRLRGPEQADWGLLRAGESRLLPAGLTRLGLEWVAGEPELVQVGVPLPVARARAGAAGGAQADVSAALAGKLANLAAARRLVSQSRGPRQVVAVVNAGDGARVGAHLRALAPAIFRADGRTSIHVHEELERRGQLLGLLDVHRELASADASGDRGVVLGIMMPGRGTRMSPLTQRLWGVKPMLPVPVVAPGPDGPLRLDAGAASLWSWGLVATTLERQGFRGVAWKWGDEPQLGARPLAAFDTDLSDVDAVRFGAEQTITEELARSKEWLLVDGVSGELSLQLRRRPRDQLLARLAELGGSALRSYAHIGSPALSHLLLDHAAELFADCPGWLDVDGYLFEALTHEPDAWSAEVERDAQLRALLARCPDFYQRVAELRRRVEASRGHRMRIAVIDFGAGLYWGDIGQLARVRALYAQLREPGADGAFARELAGIAAIEPDRYGNRIAGDSAVPDDGSVRDCVIIDTDIHRGRAEGAVVVASRLGRARLAPGSVVVESVVRELELEAGALAVAALGDRLRVPAHFAQTSIPRDPADAQLLFDSWLADMRVDVGAPSSFDEPRWGNPDSFAAKLAQLRDPSLDIAALEARVAELRARLSERLLNPPIGR